MSDADLIAYLQAWERQVAHDTAAAWTAAAAVACRVRARVRHGLPTDTWRLDAAPGSIEERAAISEVAAALHISAGAAETRIARGEALATRLAPAAALVRAGRLTASHVTVLAEHTEGRDPDLVADILARVLPRIGAKTPGDLGKALTRAEYALDPAGSSERRRTVAAERTGVWLSPGRDRREGISALILDTVDHDARWAYDVLDTLARWRLRAPDRQRTGEGTSCAVDNYGVPATTTPPPATEAVTDVAPRTRTDGVDKYGVGATTTARTGYTPSCGDNTSSDTTNPSDVDNYGVPATTDTGPKRTLPQLRADVLLDLLTAAAKDPAFPSQHGRRRIETQVVIDLPTLLALRENPALINGQPVPAPIARELATGTSTLRRLITDEVTGQLLEVGTGYTPPQAMTEFLLTRDRTCRVPGCTVRATVADLDHADEHATGGPTSIANLGALCRSHHSLKTAGHTDLTDSATDGSATWITVLGQRLSIPARPVLPVDDTEEGARTHREPGPADEAA